MISFMLRNIAALEDNLKDARRKQHFARADNLRTQLIEARAELTARLLADSRKEPAQRKCGKRLTT